MFLQGSLFSIASSSNFFRLVHNNSSSEGNTVLDCNFQFSLLLLILLIPQVFNIPQVLLKPRRKGFPGIGIGIGVAGGGGRCSTQRLHDRRPHHPFCWPWRRDRWGIGIGIGVARGGSRSNGGNFRLALWPRCMERLRAVTGGRRVSHPLRDPRCRGRWWTARGRRYSHSRCEALQVVMHSLGTHVRLLSPICVMPVHHLLRGPNTPKHGSFFGPFKGLQFAHFQASEVIQAKGTTLRVG